MKIGGLQKLTLIDFPGKVACTVFVSGCNFRCPFCYSPELVLPEQIKNNPGISEKDFSCDKKLPGFIKKIKKMGPPAGGFAVKLDTNGSNPEMLEKLIDKKLIDYVAMDIKGPKEKYGQIAGAKIDIEKIQKSINILKEGKVDYEFRSTIVPSLHMREDIIEMAKWIKGARRYYLQAFLPEKNINPEFEKIKPYPRDFLLEIQKAISPFFGICQIR